MIEIRICGDAFENFKNIGQVWKLKVLNPALLIN